MYCHFLLVKFGGGFTLSQRTSLISSGESPQMQNVVLQKNMGVIFVVQDINQEMIPILMTGFEKWA